MQHNLIDFGSALGSGGVGPADYWEGAEYIRRAARGRQAHAEPRLLPAEMADDAVLRSAIDRTAAACTAATSIPELWKPRVPNPAFLHARADDKFWAAKKLAALTTDMIRAAVRSGEFGDPAAEEFLVRALAGRRDAITRAYLTPVNPIADVAIDDAGTLTFRNAAVDADVAAAPAGYRARWSSLRQRDRRRRVARRDVRSRAAAADRDGAAAQRRRVHQGRTERVWWDTSGVGSAGERVLPPARRQLEAGRLRTDLWGKLTWTRCECRCVEGARAW